MCAAAQEWAWWQDREYHRGLRVLRRAGKSWERLTVEVG